MRKPKSLGIDPRAGRKRFYARGALLLREGERGGVVVYLLIEFEYDGSHQVRTQVRRWYDEDVEARCGYSYDGKNFRDDKTLEITSSFHSTHISASTREELI